jgi:hypothetical protein
MVTRRWTLLTLVVALLVVPAARPGERRKETYRDAARHFTVTLPDGWAVMPPDALAQVNEMAVRMGGTRYEAAFMVKGQQPGSYPYVLVQSMPRNTSGVSYEQIERELARDFSGEVKKVEGKLADIGKNLTMGKPGLDRGTNRVYNRLQMDVALFGRINGLSVGTLGKDGVVFLHCYARDADFNRLLPTFNALADTFHYDAGYEFVPGQAWTPSFDFKGGLGGGATGGIIGGAAGGIVALGFALARRASRPRAF